MIGKKVTSTITMTLGSSPNPNQITISGAIATIGIVCVPTSRGYTARRTAGTWSIATANAVAATTETANPMTVSVTVARVWVHASSRKSTSAVRIRDGDGSTSGLIPDTAT